MVHWMLWMMPFLIVWKVESYHSDLRGFLTTCPIWSGFGVFSEKYLVCYQWPVCVWFYWILVLTISLSLWAVMTCTLLNFPVSWLLEMASKTFWTVVGYFLPILRIQTLFLFLSEKELLHWLLFADLVIYDMLWCSQYCVTMIMGVPLGGKWTFTSDISSLMKGWSDRSIFNNERVELFVPSISSEPGDHSLPNLSLCSSNLENEQYLGFLVWRVLQKNVTTCY